MHGPVPLPGDLVWIRRRRWRIDRVRRDPLVIRLDVAARDRRRTFLSPFDRARREGSQPPHRVRPQQALARLARLIADSDDIRVPSAAVGAAADILPHQLEPAMAVLAGHTRVLIADEVGLGKTVQAGLVIAELWRRDASVRVLVLVPAALRDQWIEELQRRFRLPCVAADRDGLQASSREMAFGDNPWLQPGVRIGSPDFLKQRHVADALPRDPWDLLVIDEAHTICGHSERYAFAERLATQSRRVLLLTATPHGGDDGRFERLVNLGRVEAGGADPIVAFRRTRIVLGAHPPRRVRWHAVSLSDSEAQLLAALRGFERAVVARAGQDDGPLLLLSVLRKRALSTMAALSKSLVRRLAWLGDLGPEAALEWSQPRLAFEGETDQVDQEERDGLTVHTGLGNRQERSWLRRLRTLADEAAREERKVARLARLIERTTEPAVVFTEFRDSLEVVCRRLRFSRTVAVLHGGQDPIERRHQLAQFLDGTASVLVATDVAGQGLNLQSRARWVISLELPWNPTRLEQRIGRVDRILQTRSTHLTLLVARDEAESGLLAHLSRRILSAQQAIGHDTLAGVTPPASVLRAALLRQVDPPVSSRPAGLSSEPEPLAMCRRWERPAACVARSLARRRALAAVWRAPDQAFGTPVFTHHPRAGRLAPAGSRALAVFSVPILDADDIAIERRVVAMASRADVGDARACRAIAAALQPQVVDAIKSRVAATARRLTRAGERAARRARAMDRALREERRATEVQPGLFNRAESRALDSEEQRADRILSTNARHLERADQAGVGVHAGQPVLEILLGKRS